MLVGGEPNLLLMVDMVNIQGFTHPRWCRSSSIKVSFSFSNLPQKTPPLPQPTDQPTPFNSLGSKAIAEDLEDGDGLLQLGDLRIFWVVREGRGLPSRKLTYPVKNWHFEDDFPFPKVGYVNPLEGILYWVVKLQRCVFFQFFHPLGWCLFLAILRRCLFLGMVKT